MIGLAGESARDMVIAQPIGQQVTFPYRRRTGAQRLPASLMGNIAYVRQLYLDLDHYKQAKESRRPEYDHALEGLGGISARAPACRGSAADRPHAELRAGIENAGYFIWSA